MTIAIDKKELLALVEMGYTNAQLAEHFGCTVRTIDRRRRDDPEFSRAIIKARAQIIEAAAEHGTVRRYGRGCRCRSCRIANNTRCYETRMQWRERNGLGPPNPNRGRKRNVQYAVRNPIHAADRDTLIAQAIARGETTSRIMRQLSCDYAIVQAVRDQMTEAQAS